MSTQPRKPAGSPNSTGGQYDVNPSANVSLPALVPPPAANSVRRTLPARAPARVWSETGGVRQRNQASDPDPRIRFQLACNPYADRLVLADLAGDDNVRVRRAVAYTAPYQTRCCADCWTTRMRACARMPSNRRTRTTITMSDIKSIIKHELEDGGYIWMEDSTSRFKVVGENGTLELAPITLAGFPYIAFGMNAQGRPSVNGTILLWHADETKTRALVSGVLANIIR